MMLIIVMKMIQVVLVIVIVMLVFFCVGDHRETATLNGALVSGRRAAELIIKSRK